VKRGIEYQIQRKGCRAQPLQKKRGIGTKKFP